MINESDYTFVALDHSRDKWIVLDIRSADDDSIEYQRKVWHKLSLAVRYASERADENPPDWTEWKPFEWTRKKVPHRNCFVAWNGDVMGGFINLRTKFPSQSSPGTEVIYIENVATFPGNIPTILWRKRLAGVGSALLAYAVLQAKKQGYLRIGLHAAGEAEGWYDDLHQRHDDLFEVRQTGVPGFHNDNESQVYYESSIAGADSLLEDYYDA